MNREFRLLSRTGGTFLAYPLFLMAVASIGAALGAGSPASNHIAVSLQKLDAAGVCSIAAVASGAKLKAILQDLEAEATTEGLWITSTADEDAGKKGNRFMVRAEGLGREIIDPLPLHGRVEVFDKVVAWARPMIVEEYRVGIEGVRQDFVLRERPRHDGELSVALKLRGARELRSQTYREGHGKGAGLPPVAGY